jgi:hypothetical protein
MTFLLLQTEFRLKFFKDHKFTSDEQLFDKASAWYCASYDSGSDSSTRSFPWIVYDVVSSFSSLLFIHPCHTSRSHLPAEQNESGCRYSQKWRTTLC